MVLSLIIAVLFLRKSQIKIDHEKAYKVFRTIVIIIVISLLLIDLLIMLAVRDKIFIFFSILLDRLSISLMSIFNNGDVSFQTEKFRYLNYTDVLGLISISNLFVLTIIGAVCIVREIVGSENLIVLETEEKHCISIHSSLVKLFSHTRRLSIGVQYKPLP